VAATDDAGLGADAFEAAQAAPPPNAAMTTLTITNFDARDISQSGWNRYVRGMSPERKSGVKSARRARKSRSERSL
jgi:hypothetical protein